MKKIIFFGIIAIALIWGFRHFHSEQASWSDQQKENLAICLRDRNVVMYGQKTCIHCLNQERLFGRAWKEILYVECLDEPDRCNAAQINGTPTWVFPNGTRLEGEQELKVLAEKASCQI